MKQMKFPVSKLGIILVIVFLVIIGVVILAEELGIIKGESGPPLLIAFLFWGNLFLSLPIIIIGSLLPIKTTGLIGLALNVIMLYFVGTGIQLFVRRNKKSPRNSVSEAL